MDCVLLLLRNLFVRFEKLVVLSCVRLLLVLLCIFRSVGMVLEVFVV